jgi:hypothetical protein
VFGEAMAREDAVVASFGRANWSNDMDAAHKPDNQPAEAAFDRLAEELPLSEAQADSLLKQKRKEGTSGLSWDEVVSDNRNGWREATQMGEGD